MTAAGCPTPTKIRYATREAAEGRTRVWQFTLPDRTEVYLCPCGFFHSRNAAKAAARRAYLTIEGPK